MENRSGGNGAVNVQKNGSTLTDDTAKANLFARHFAKVSSTANNREPFASTKVLTGQISLNKINAARVHTSDPLNDPFSAAEL